MEQLTVLCPSLLSRWPDEIRGKPPSVCVIPQQPLQLHRGRSASSRLIPGGASPASAASSRRKAGSGPEQRSGAAVREAGKGSVKVSSSSPAGGTAGGGGRGAGRGLCAALLPRAASPSSSLRKGDRKRHGSTQRRSSGRIQRNQPNQQGWLRSPRDKSASGWIV